VEVGHENALVSVPHCVRDSRYWACGPDVQKRISAYGVECSSKEAKAPPRRGNSAALSGYMAVFAGDKRFV
jgi:hypothetical protein